MKFSKSLIALSALMLASCSSSFRANAGASVTTYLVLSAVGQYSGPAKVEAKLPEKFLENVIVFEAEAGSALPGKDQISATSGAEFLSWVCYEGLGAPSVYEKVPEESGKILYAYFEGGDAGSVTPVEPGEDMTITVTDAPTWITNDGCVIFAWAWNAQGNGAWYSCTYGAGEKPTSFSFTVPGNSTGCLLARCAANTVTPDWNQKTDGPGKVYNKTGDITFVAGQTTYTSPNWVDA